MDFLDTFWLYLLRSAPYLMFGLLISGVAHHFISLKLIERNLGKNSIWSILKAALIGIPLPLCSCAVIPASITLKKSGASNGATSAFLISTPESGIDSIFMTYGMMDIAMTIIRPLAAFFSAMLAGFLQLFFNDDSEDAVPSRGSCCPQTGKRSVAKNSLFNILDYGFNKLLKDMSVWLTVGLILGAILMYAVPEDTFYKFSQTQNKLIILALGIPFYICASATTPIAAALVLKGMSPGTALLLLLLGPATNLSNLMIMQKYIGKKGVALNLLAIISVALIMSFLTDYFYQVMQWSVDFSIGMNHDESIHPVMIVITVAFIFLLLLSLKNRLLKN